MMMERPSKIDLLVNAKINEFFTAERVLCSIGWVSLKNTGIKYRPEYLNAFSFATEVDEIEYISQFTRDANIDVVKDFYRQTNGMRLLCDKFRVPGVLVHRDDFAGHDFDCVALDFSNHGGFSMPKYAPETGLLIGGSQRTKDGKAVEIHDILTKSGEIIGGAFDETSEVTDRFPTIPEWLSSRIEVASTELRREIAELDVG